MKNPNLGLLKIFLCFLFIVTCNLRLAASSLFAQDADLTKKVIEAGREQDIHASFENLKESYFKDNKYAEFIQSLKSLAAEKKGIEPYINYYTALARYYQLKYLEEKQEWDEYFSQGNNYRDEIVLNAQKAIAATKAEETLNVYARLILWQFHRDQQDAFLEESLAGLMNSISDYSKTSGDAKVIKAVADKLLSYGEKARAKDLYKIYVDKIIASDINNDELSGIASGFYKEENLELAETVYDVYIERITKALAKEKLIPILIDIARLFAYKDQGPKDTLYAEKIFKKIEEAGGRESFDQELIYLRAFNLEKAKDFQGAKDNYAVLTKQYPENLHNDEAVFKSGMISIYILRDIKSGKDYLQKLAQKTKPSPQVVSSFYQLGLLSQWEGDLAGAKKYYEKLIEIAGADFQETVNLAKERGKEIDGAKPIEYNLKMFLDVSLKEENAIFDRTKLDLKSHPYLAKKDESVNIGSSPYVAQSGCMPVEIQYLWSGHIGTAAPPLSEASFSTTYKYSGTKEINLVAVSPTGVIDRDMDFVDAY